jgi:putative membrane protein
VLSVIYAAGVIAVRRKGEKWSGLLIAAFYLLGIGSFLVVDFGFLGALSHDLRWAFSTRTALLLFVTPALLALGRPVGLARLALSGRGVGNLDRIMASRPMRIAGNAVVPPLATVAIFSIFLTQFAGVLRLSPVGQAAVTILIPVIGLLLVLPLVEYSSQRTAFFVTVEFLFAFVELVIDALPGILLRLNGVVVDQLPAIAGSHPFWWPAPIRDQQLSGDLLWFIAELADIPVLIILFVRWSRVDRKEARSYDDLTDEQMDALTQEHLRANRQS